MNEPATISVILPQLSLETNAKEQTQKSDIDKENLLLNIDPLKNNSEKNSTNPHEIQKLFITTATNEALQGLFKILFSSKKTIKIFWIFSLIVTNGLNAYLIIQSILAYLSFGVSTSSKSLTEVPTLFPKITICNNNQFTSEYSIGFLKEINQQVQPTIDIFNDTQMSLLNYSVKLDAINVVYESAIAKMLSKNFSDAERKQLGHSLDDILFKCTFNNVPCTSDDFVWKFDRFYGNCFVFNSGVNQTGHKTNLKESLLAGSNYGLSVDFYIGFNEKLTLFNSAYGIGGFLKIENSSLILDDTLDGIFLTPGQNPSISIERRFIFHLPKPYSNCDIENDVSYSTSSFIYNAIFHSKYDYTQQLCFNQCLQGRINQTCKCTDPQALFLFNSTHCETAHQLDCMSNVYENVLSSNFFNARCLSLCPLECNQTLYTTSISSIELIGNMYADFINTNPNLLSDFNVSEVNVETARRNFVSADLYYNALAYTLSEEKPSLDIVGLLANIGGTMGLFLGISLLHVCEVVEAFIELGFLLAEKRKRKIQTS